MRTSAQQIGKRHNDFLPAPAHDGSMIDQIAEAGDNRSLTIANSVRVVTGNLWRRNHDLDLKQLDVPPAYKRGRAVLGDGIAHGAGWALTVSQLAFAFLM